jgi:Flp pilus assembly protein TadG
MWFYCSSKRRQSGQILPIAAAAFLVMCGLAGLAIDASRDYLTKRDAQNAADFATLAAAKEMTLLGSINSPIAANSNTVQAAHDFAQTNGFPTIYSNGCDVSTGTTFTTTWFDSAGPSCGATTGFINKVSVNSPPVNLPGSPVPLSCIGTGKYSCVQVVITTRIAQLFTAVLGIQFAYVTVGASAQAALPASAYDAPPPNALTLYQPASVQGGCLPVTQQCFDETKAATRTAMACTGGTNNCPTMWVKANTTPEFDGYDGSVFSPVRDLTAIQSAGDMVIQARTTFCDPYNGATCVANSIKGAAGFAVPVGTKMYCSKYGAGATTTTPCTTSGQATLNEVDGNQTGWTTPTPWYPTVDTTGLTNCGGLILNGGVVTGPCADPTQEYVINPGIYSYIVINHGACEHADGGLIPGQRHRSQERDRRRRLRSVHHGDCKRMPDPDRRRVDRPRRRRLRCLRQPGPRSVQQQQRGHRRRRRRRHRRFGQWLRLQARVDLGRLRVHQRGDEPGAGRGRYRRPRRGQRDTTAHR